MMTISVYLNRPPQRSGVFEINASLHTNGRYPMLIAEETPNKITMEIYNVSDEELAAIDALELPFNYDRREIMLDGQRCWIYFYTPGTPPSDFVPVPSGNFQAEVEWE